MDQATLRNIALGLVNTVQTREQRYQATLGDLQEERDLLNDHLTANTAQYFTPPDGFTPNNGRLPHFTVLVDDGITQTVRWIQLLHDGCAAGYLTEDNPSSDPYIMELYTRPAILTPNTPTEPIPAWFRQLLHGPQQQFGELRDVARCYNADWGVYMDLICYRDLDNQADWLRQELDVVSSELCAAQDARMVCEGRLAAANAVAHFAHLQHTRHT
jgi:hypothetical protein